MDETYTVIQRFSGLQEAELWQPGWESELARISSCYIGWPNRPDELILRNELPIAVRVRRSARILRDFCVGSRKLATFLFGHYKQQGMLIAASAYDLACSVDRLEIPRSVESFGGRSSYP